MVVRYHLCKSACFDCPRVPRLMVVTRLGDGKLRVMRISKLKHYYGVLTSRCLTNPALLFLLLKGTHRTLLSTIINHGQTEPYEHTVAPSSLTSVAQCGLSFRCCLVTLSGSSIHYCGMLAICCILHCSRDLFFMHGSRIWYKHIDSIVSYMSTCVLFSFRHDRFSTPPWLK